MANAWIIKPLPLVSVVANPGTLDGHDPAFVGNDFAGVIWRSTPVTGSGYVQLQIDLGSDHAVDTIMGFGIDGVAADSQLQIAAATEAQGPSFANIVYGNAPEPLVPAGSQSMTSGKVLGIWSEAAPIVARYWLFRIWYTSAAEIGVSRLVIGQRIELDRNFTFGATFGVRDLGSVDFSRLGVMQRKRGAKLRTTTLTFTSIHKAEVETAVQPLLEAVGNTELVAVITDPSPHPNRMNRCYFGPLVGDIGTTWRRADAFQAATNVVSIF